jgi:uncharacterized lipoprotein YmbA
MCDGQREVAVSGTRLLTSGHQGARRPVRASTTEKMEGTYEMVRAVANSHNEASKAMRSEGDDGR